MSESAETKVLSTEMKTPANVVVKPNTYITLQYALFHYYKQAGKHEMAFTEDSTTTIREAMKMQGIKYGVGGDAFANSFYSICLGKENNRIRKANTENIKKAIELLSDYPAGKIIAEEELKKAEILP